MPIYAVILNNYNQYDKPYLFSPDFLKTCNSQDLLRKLLFELYARRRYSENKTLKLFFEISGFNEWGSKIDIIENGLEAETRLKQSLQTRIMSSSACEEEFLCGVTIKLLCSKEQFDNAYASYANYLNDNPLDYDSISYNKIPPQAYYAHIHDIQFAQQIEAIYLQYHPGFVDPETGRDWSSSRRFLQRTMINTSQFQPTKRHFPTNTSLFSQRHAFAFNDIVLITQPADQPSLPPVTLPKEMVKPTIEIESESDYAPAANEASAKQIIKMNHRPVTQPEQPEISPIEIGSENDYVPLLKHVKKEYEALAKQLEKIEYQYSQQLTPLINLTFWHYRDIIAYDAIVHKKPANKKDIQDKTLVYLEKANNILEQLQNNPAFIKDQFKANLLRLILHFVVTASAMIFGTSMGTLAGGIIAGPGGALLGGAIGGAAGLAIGEVFSSFFLQEKDTYGKLKYLVKNCTNKIQSLLKQDEKKSTLVIPAIAVRP